MLTVLLSRDSADVVCLSKLGDSAALTIRRVQSAWSIEAYEQVLSLDRKDFALEMSQALNAPGSHGNYLLKRKREKPM